MLSECKQRQVKGITEYIAHDEGERVHEILGDRCIQSAVAFDIQWKINKSRSPHSRRNSTRQSHNQDTSRTASKAAGSPPISLVPTSGSSLAEKRQLPDGPPGNLQKKVKLSNSHDSSRTGSKADSGSLNYPSTFTSTTVESLDEAEMRFWQTAAETGAEIPVPDRISTRILMSRGKVIDDFANPIELLLAMRDAVRGHWSLLIDGRFLHRDISVNNIIITMPSYPRDDGFEGFLIDLDHAISTDETARRVGVPERTGTFEFMSIDALRGHWDFQHTYYDDLQSFMWVFVWLIVKDRNNCPEVRMWSNYNPKVTADIKAQQISSEMEFKYRFSEWFDGGLGDSVGQAANALRRALQWPVDRHDLEKEEVRTRLYKSVIAAFEDALVVARAEAKPDRRVVPRDRMAD